MKYDKLIKNKSQAELYKAQVHTNLAKKKMGKKLRSSKSQAHIPREEIDPRDPTLKYVKNPQIRTQKKLFSQRKKDFLTDMRK